MIKILKGDDATRKISFNLPDVAYISGSLLELALPGITMTFAAARELSLRFPAEWTAKQPLGRTFGTWTLISPEGERSTVSNTFQVYLSNDLADVESTAKIVPNVTGDVDLADIPSLGAEASVSDIKAAYNAILAKLKTALLSGVCLTTGVLFALSPVTTFNEIPGTNTIADIVSAAGGTIAGGTDGAAVTNIASGIVGAATNALRTVVSREIAAFAAEVPGTVTNVVRATKGLVYDEKLGVTWKQTMYDGNLYYVAVTNANITEVK